MLHCFIIAGKPVRLWQNNGESYEHVLMKALGFAMFVGRYANLQIETAVGLRYKPDLISRASDGTFDFWGECGSNSMRKTAWILKHAGAHLVVLFRIEQNSKQLAARLREKIPMRYRSPGRLMPVNFRDQIFSLTAAGRIAAVEADWFEAVFV